LHDWFGAWGNQHIDSTELLWDFFSNVCEQPTTGAINPLSSSTFNRQLLRITDILGRTVNEETLRGGLLLYVYSDGTVEKRMTVNR